MKEKTNKVIATYADSYLDFPSPGLVSKKEYSNIIVTFSLLLLNSIITTGLAYKIPYGFGIIGVTKKKYNISLIDWVRTREDGKLVKYKRTHSDGWTPKFFWNKKRSHGGRFIFTDIWRFRWSKIAKRAMHQEATINNTIIKYY